MPTAILVDSVSTGQGVDIALVRTGTASPYIPGHQAGFRLVEDFGGVLLRSALDCEVGIFLATNDVQLGGTAGGAVVIPSGVAVTNDLAHSIPVTLTSSSNTTPIPVSLANIRVSNTPEQAIPVLFGGTVAPVLGVVTVDNTNAEAIPVLQKPGEVFEVHVNNVDGQALPVVQKAGHVFTVEQATEVDTRPYLAAVVNDRVPVAVAAAVGVLVTVSATRRGLRIKNAGAAAVAIGGATLAYATAAVLIQPGETWNENEAPGAAWWCVCDAAKASTLNVQEIT
ncbi:hypothetical protein AKG95_13670 [Janthinobacterium lividum]|uniref:Uncharacterized protein n=1 Tax=Janthinobacterium lividum TaxID=29581 RepID=A0A1S1U830_9BURK|nr:hypothetical protein [Janthinobacterium lividum]OHV95924.1 hypothetical protein AKG95_13670 [Janthinobacterium lividum]